LPRNEQQYYDSILDWLKEHEYYVGGHIVEGEEFYYKRKGAVGRIPDCCGVKNAGNRFLDDIEVAAVEVKDRKITPRHVQQTLGYSIMAHKVYIAGKDSVLSLSDEVHRLLETAGVGYLEIRVKKAANSWEIAEGISALRQRPNQAELLSLLDNLGINQCTICQGYFLRRIVVDGEPFHTMERIVRPRYIDYYAGGLGEPFHLGTRKQLDTGYRIRRYICRACLSELPKIVDHWRGGSGE